ncbi:MAG: DUF721 domain-containing protein [Candidatus Mcinerneyibacterium aminivorans]|jgi:predicted nucleic acid-binding Zn ribbon protein|uniref:DUF721 domain-containing protein n=1 Tax=Candidatus Mcinerneyibacterium aminivorans TaxID=2703815 RepID=A0A5D0MDJ8_9BACT|nr:MAG: DUF721 domain-containing protein [Candidatus Mcinerneyibacterium aminivorans]
MDNLGKIIKKVINKDFNNQITKLKENWNKIVDSDVAMNTEPTILRKKRLNVKCSSSVWIQEMMLRKEGLITKINDYFEDEVVKEIYFKQ